MGQITNCWRELLRISIFLANEIDIFETKLAWLHKFYLVENIYIFIDIVNMFLHLPFM